MSDKSRKRAADERRARRDRELAELAGVARERSRIVWWLRKQTGAEAVIVVVVGGRHGHGFSTQMNDPAMLARLPEVLRQIAADIEKDT